ncbi:uncharacterized protein Z518_10486 [Rhinocladiella mackenziei CBS 650.93]|uniref:Heterokaryon incompatibility domain-containing protein n=1 Tax=Rhinocladiella mackenziei CBS 650.93 TaxID=1442369 RepID=A0A0D2FE43_9EURO|nr:uncharacterized protein Z518_10486 [Rhinocladiella mackenziei CBS 650.93]KIX00347.1 hypothetical protein Z518_10486 [Rhinocladiella mackenziei CBS 650.93]
MNPAKPFPNPVHESAHAQRNGLVIVSHYCPERPYVELGVPTSIREVHKIIFKTVSHDQGYSNDDATLRGTYEQSFTWFEASVITPSARDRVPRRHLQSNLHAISDFREHEICWNLEEAEVSLKRWLRAIKPGDTVQIVPKARHQAWRNYVAAASITVFGLGGEQVGHPSPSAPDLNIYRPLTRAKEIRLVSLQSGNTDHQVHCILEHAELGDDVQEPYECMSYCWGDRGDPKVVRLSCCPEGESKPVESLVPITSNLHDALLRLRHPSKPRKIWIDAISINQSDPHECSLQVALMREIYSQAEDVIVWLGERNDGNDGCLADAEMIAERYLQRSDLDQSTTKLHSPLLDNGSYHVDNPLFRNDYFRRAWVLQEVFNARHVSVLYGGTLMSWARILRLNECITRSTVYSNPIAKNTMPPLFSELFTPHSLRKSVKNTAYLQEYSRQTTKMGILDVVLEGLDLETTDPRDKIFALLSFGQETWDFSCHGAEIRPDYTKTPARVFADFTRWWIRTHKSLRILSTIHLSRGRTWVNLSPSSALNGSNDRPSWSFWHTGRSVWAQGTLGLSAESPYRVAGNTDPVIEETVDPMVLGVRGRQIGVISKIRPYPYYPIYVSMHVGDNPAQRRYQDLHEAYVHLFDPLSWRGTWTSRVQRGDVQKLRQPYDQTETFQKNMDHLATHASLDPEKENHLIRDILQDPQNTLVGCHAPCFIQTSAGDEGLCPAAARPGDVIVALYGSRVPYILRPLPQESSHTDDAGATIHLSYQLVGECYLENYMYGKAVKEDDNGEQQGCPEKTFYLI